LRLYDHIVGFPDSWAIARATASWSSRASGCPRPAGPSPRGTSRRGWFRSR